MRMPMLARSHVSLLTMLATGGLLLSACGPEATAPGTPASGSLMRVSSFAPNANARALFGVSDGVYTITVDPTQDQSFNLGTTNHIDFPANSICDLAATSYGESHWNEECTPETQAVTLTVTIDKARSSHPRIDFQPAMRFSPDKQVMLYMYSPHVEVSDAWTMLYCNALSECADEASADSDLRTYADPSASVVFRRIKHFSGYTISQDAFEAM
jgi:hypothetical protein